MHDDLDAKSFASVGSLFDFVLDNIFGQANARKFTSTTYDPIDVIEEAHSINVMSSFKQQMQTCDLLFRKVITTRESSANHTNVRPRRTDFVYRLPPNVTSVRSVLTKII